MKYLKITTAMLAALSISACSGGSDSGPTTEAPATSAEKIAIARSIVHAIDDGVNAGDLTDRFLVPTTGTANYAGVMTLPDPSAAGILVGTGDMDVDFATADVTGSIGNFTNSVDEAWSGSLSFDGNFGVAVEVDGTLTSEAGVDTVIDAEAELANHKNYGSTDTGEQTPEYYTGNLIGTATTDTDVVVLDDTNSLYFGDLTD